MVEKRKLPARAAARAEQSSKRRTATPPELTPAAAEHQDTPAEETPPPPPLPRSVQAGKPLPTVETPQPEDLPSKDFQTVQESGVLSESLGRSRQKWISEGIFEKYWTKPYKRKGVIYEEPNNPPKESMTKVGPVTITVEPHVFEATMFIIKDPKPPLTTNAIFRPILQYGPPGGAMPAPAPAPPRVVTPVPIPLMPGQPAPSPAPAAAPLPAQVAAEKTAQPAENVAEQQAPGSQPSASTVRAGVPAAAEVPPGPAINQQRPIASPRGMESILSPTTAAPTVAQRPSVPPPPIPHTMDRSPSIASLTGSRPATSGESVAIRPPPLSVGQETVANGSPVSSSSKPNGTAPGADPIIITLAERATEDPELRELMKRVAQGDAAKPELVKFQAIIDQITNESRKRGGPGPSADRLLVDGKTVKYFADEVNAILDIVLRSNARQTSAGLRPPEGSDPLVVLLVKSALDENRTKDMVRRIAENRPHFSDPTDLKSLLERLKARIQHGLGSSQSPAPSAPATPSIRQSAVPLPPQQPAPQQALRSKGPPPAERHNINAVVFEFSGGTGDRYLFPKFSILEYVPTAAGPNNGQHVIASFLIVRRGSTADYPVADPSLDYYQPVTVRFFTQTGRYLEHLARVVAPQDEVRRYMDDIMHRMTRAEYVLLAMRLPRNEGTGSGREDGSGEETEKGKELAHIKREKDASRIVSGGVETFRFVNSHAATINGPNGPQGAGLWTARAVAPRPADGFGHAGDGATGGYENGQNWPRTMFGKPMDEGELAPIESQMGKLDEDKRYQDFIGSVSRREPEEVA